MDKPRTRWVMACTQIVVSLSLIVWIVLNIDLKNTVQLVATTSVLSTDILYYFACISCPYRRQFDGVGLLPDLWVMGWCRLT